MYSACRETFLDKDILTLILTHRCNFNCKHCLTVKNNQAISFGTAKKAIDLFFSTPPRRTKPILIRFFGGEPLLEFKLIRKIVSYSKRISRKKKIKVFFLLSTNAALLKKAKIDILKKYKNFEISINTYTFLRQGLQKSISGIPGVGINFLIEPDCAKLLYFRFLSLLNLGFRDFNFLPVFFVRWDKIQLEELKKGLGEVSRFLKKFSASLGIFIKNIYNFSPTPLFNQNLTVDCNGDIYYSTLAFTKYFYREKQNFKLGNVSESRTLPRPLKNNIDLKFRKVPEEVLSCTYTVNTIVSNFVKQLIL